MLLWLFYALVFTQTIGEGAGQALVDAGANVLPLTLLAAATHILVKGQLRDK
ncbi:MAG: hypothetical protein RQ833_00490 [Sphingomonadaceae bacterium]|nr:hypothetical protein [Sphingomonadaceae bacterium]